MENCFNPPPVAAPEPSPAGRAPGRHRFDGDQFMQMVNLGFFEGNRVELVAGEVIDMPAQGNEHYTLIEEVRDVLVEVFGPEFWVRVQATLDLSPHGMPDPDLAVVPGSRRPLRKANPTSAVLVVEVSDSRLVYDRTTKAGLYAAAGVPDYWVVNVPDRVLEVRRDPRPDAAHEFGHAYGSLVTLAPGSTATPLARPGGVVAVDRLFL